MRAQQTVGGLYSMSAGSDALVQSSTMNAAAAVFLLVFGRQHAGTAWCGVVVMV